MASDRTLTRRINWVLGELAMRSLIPVAKMSRTVSDAAKAKDMMQSAAKAAMQAFPMDELQPHFDAVKQVTKAVAHQAGSAAEQVVDTAQGAAGTAARHGGQVMQKVGGLTQRTAGTAVQHAGNVAQKVGGFSQRAAGAAVQGAGSVARKATGLTHQVAGAVVQRAGSTVQKVGGVTQRAAGTVVNKAGAVAQQVGSATQQAIGSMAQQAGVTSQQARAQAHLKVGNMLQQVHQQQQAAEQQLGVIHTQIAFGSGGSSGSGQTDEPSMASQVAQALAGMPNNAMLDGVKYGHTMWSLQAGFRDLVVMAVSAIGQPGCLHGPNIEASILTSPQMASATGIGAEICHGVAKGVARCFFDWQENVTVPGLPWYPAFVAFPAPQAPPMPNIPMPLASCVSTRAHRITTPSQLEDEMYDAMPDDLKIQAVRTYLSGLASQIAMYFGIWLASQQVTMVMGMGPVPSFAPPYVPVGPVVGGSTIPGVHLLT